MTGARPNFRRTNHGRRWLLALALATFVASARLALADEQPAPTTRPALQQLNDETTSLYDQVQAGIVHVAIPREPFQRPVSQPIQPQPQVQNPSTKPTGFNPAGDAGETMPQVSVNSSPATNIIVTAHSSDGGTITVVQSKVGMVAPLNQPTPADSGGNPVFGARMRAAQAVPSGIAILLDEQGHILVPSYIDHPADGDPPMRVAGPDGSMQSAKFVGSDRQTNLSVLQLEKPTGTPLQMTGDRPAKGSLVLYVSPADGSGRLGMWNGGAGEFCMIVSIDGRVDGIARFGQFLNGSACRFIADQLVRFGSVKRASLGIFISEILPDDPIRTQLPALGAHSAMKVVNVIAGSAADKAGLKPGDVVLELAGQPVNDIPSFAAAIAAREGHTDVQVLRGEQILTVTADLEPK